MIVSVIIPTFNAALLIKRTLQSILTQNGNYKYEIILVDDCSTDNTLEIVKQLHLPAITVLRQDRNQGPAAARNRGIKAATGKYLAFLDGDDYWLPDFLAKTIPFLEKNPEAVAVSVGQIHKTVNRPEHVTPAVIVQDFSLRPCVLHDFYLYWAENDHVCTGSVLMRTNIVQQTGGQREDLRVCEDLEFWALLATFGPWGFIPEVLFVSDGGAVTQAQGWLAKNQRRWASAVPVENWNQRIIPRLQPEYKKSFLKKQGIIAQNLCYSMILSKRSKLAFETCRKYKKYFPNSKAGRIFKCLSHNYFLWSVFCIALRFYEYHRKVK